MEYFALLFVTTVIIASLAAVLFGRTRDPGILLGLAGLYYWSLFGAWYIIIDKTGGSSGKNYHYLEHKLFPIVLDHNYLLTLGLYAAFIIAVELVMLALLSEPSARIRSHVVIRHGPVLLICSLAAAGSMYLISDKLSEAWALNSSAYWYTRTDTGPWFTLHQVLNRVAMLPAAIGLASLAAGRRNRHFINARRRYDLAGYVLLFLAMGVFTFVLGNKNEVLVSLLAGLLAYLACAKRPNYWKLSGMLALGLWFLYAIDFFRAVPLAEMTQAIQGRLEDATQVGRFLTSSNEAYAAHFSLYGVLAGNVEPRFGYSFYALLCSAVPRVVWPGRPPDIYLYYSESVGAIQNQGYSLHHATGWYLNFGIAGVVLGGLVLGLGWTYCINARRRLRRGSGLIPRLFATIAPWLFVAYLPALVRAGPEGYKGLFIEGFQIPVATLLIACHKPRRRKVLIRRPALRMGPVLIPAQVKQDIK